MIYFTYYSDFVIYIFLEFALLLGALDFLHETDSNNYDKSQSDFETAKERVWEGFQIRNGHYYHPKFYSDGTVVKAGDIGDKNSPSQMHDDENHNKYNIFGNI